jgi:hypothetical protein
MRPCSAPLLSTLILSLLATPSFAADELMLRQRIMSSTTGKAEDRQQTQYYAGSVRITDDDRYRTIADLDKRTLTVINKGKRTYSVSTFAELEKRNESHDKKVQSLPGQVRDMIHADVKVELKPTGKTDTIAGYAAKEYSFDAPGVVGSVWIAEGLDFGAKAKEWTKLSPVFGGENSPGGHLEAAISQIKGVPLRRIVTMEPLPLVTIEAVEVQKQAPPAEMRTIPQGFQKIELSQPKPKPTPSPVRAKPSGKP